MKAHMQQTIVELSLRAYPLLVLKLRLLAALAEHDAQLNVATLVLFGSTAGLVAGRSSDVDLFVAFGEQAAGDEEDVFLLFLTRMRTLVELAGDDANDWHFVPIFSRQQSVSTLDPDFVAEIGRTGVLVYQRAGVPIAAELAGLRTFDEWAADVERLVAALRLADAALHA